MMFGIFRKKNTSSAEPSGQIDLDKIRVFYEGEVICGDYDLNNPEDYPFHNLFPHGKGKITYIEGETIVQQYEGQFNAGQYHGKGCLVDQHGGVYEGYFIHNRWVK